MPKNYFLHFSFGKNVPILSRNIEFYKLLFTVLELGLGLKFHSSEVKIDILTFFVKICQNLQNL